MTSKDQTREMIENLEFQASQDMHDRIISGIRSTSVQQPSRYMSPKAWAYGAAAAMVLILVSLWLTQPQHTNRGWTSLSLTSTHVLSMRSLDQAFYDDGLEGLEDHLEASLMQVGPRPTETLMQGLYENIDL